MKGQMIFEFIVAAIVFFGIIFYVLSYLNVNVTTMSTDYYSNSLESKAVGISELLFKTQGFWVGGIPDSIGLASEWPELDSQKIEWLRVYCLEAGGYTDILDKLGLKEELPIGEVTYKVRVNIGGERICGPSVPKDIGRGSITRYLVVDGNITKSEIFVW
jgi:hypothetical protein